MTIWNAPEPVPEHPKMACLAALRCRDAALLLRGHPNGAGFPYSKPVSACIAPLPSSAFWRERPNEFTAIGDAINLASRLEGLNRLYGTSIIASENIVERARKAFDFRLLDIVAVKGKATRSKSTSCSEQKAQRKGAAK